MSYSIYDVNGYVADGPNISGWAALRDQVLLPEGGPTTHEFVENGETEDLESFAVELDQIETPNGVLGTLFTALKEAVDQAEGVVILSTGVGTGRPDDLPIDVAYLTEDDE